MITVSKTFLSSTFFLLVPLFVALAAGGHLVGNHLASRLEQEARDNAASVQHLMEAATKASFGQMLRSVADNNLAFLTSLHQKHQTGALSLDEAKWLALETLAAQTVGRSGYIFSFNSQHGLTRSIDSGNWRRRCRPVCILTDLPMKQDSIDQREGRF